MPIQGISDNFFNGELAPGGSSSPAFGILESITAAVPFQEDVQVHRH
jgi:hypothetical protein